MCRSSAHTAERFGKKKKGLKMAGAKDDGYDVAAALAEFHASRGGVRGLVDSGVTAVPRLFLAPNAPAPPQEQPPSGATDFAIPTVDLSLPHAETVAQVRAGARSCGFFHVVNHGVQTATIDAAVAAARAFHEQPLAGRSALYSLEPNGLGGVAYSTIPHPPMTHGDGAPPVPWRDTLRVRFGPQEPDLGRLPAACGHALGEYQRALTRFGKTMAGLLSEALGVGAERLERAMRVEGWLMACHYYPPCPEPERVAASLEHTDPSLFTVLAQDGVGGLQVRRDTDDTSGDGEWVDVLPVTGALLVNAGDVLKMISNDEFKSVEHRVIIKSTQDARVSIALFFNPAKRDEPDRFGPLPELVTAKSPARYQTFTVPEFMNSRRESGHGKSSIERFKIT